MSTVVGVIEYDAKINTAQLKKDAKEAEAVARDTGDQLGTNVEKGSSRASVALARLGNAAKLSAIALGASSVAGSLFAIKAAANYEQSLNIFKSVSSATNQEMEKVANTARELGKDITLPGVSAKDAALAMTELAKAGISVNDTLDASKGVLSLAKAGQLDTAQAAEITANALNAFSLGGKEANRVADLLAASANASSANVTDLALGLQMSSASAASVKVPVEDLVTALAAMANNGIKGSDAGTSLKTMFMNLIPTTTKAKESMQALNLDFYDAQGTFVGMRKVIEQLQKGTEGLTDEQKALHIENIFGADSSRAVNILLKEGVQGYDDLSKAVNKQGAATELAAAQNSGFNGSLDALKSTLETIAIDAGTKVLPALTGMVKALTSGAESSVDLAKQFIQFGKRGLDYLSPKIEALKNSFVELMPPVKTFIERYLYPLATLLGHVLVGAVGIVIDALNLLVNAFRPLISWLNNNQTAVMGVVAALTALWAAMKVRAGFMALDSALAVLRMSFVAQTVATVGLSGSIGVAVNAFKAFMIAIGPVGWAIGLVTAAAGLLGMAFGRNKDQADRLKDAQQRLRDSTRNLKTAQDDLALANLGVEGAALRQERAERNLKDMIALYGEGSLEARDAAYELELAKLAVRDAADKAKESVDKLKEAEKQYAENGGLIESADKKAKALQLMSDLIRQPVIAGPVIYQPSSGGMPTGATSGAAANFQRLGQNANGTDYWKGGPTWVGERGPEIVDLPRGSRVIPNHEIGAQNSSSIENNINTINIAKEADGESWLRKLTKNQEITSTGLTPVMGLM